MGRLLKLAIPLTLLAAYPAAACENASMRAIFYTCSCGGRVFVNVCSGGGGQCEPLRSEVQCGACYVGSAGGCLSSSANARQSEALPALDDGLGLTATPVSCSSARPGALEEWVNSGSRRVR